MSDEIMNKVKKNKFVVMIATVLVLMILFTILAYTVTPKYVVFGEMQEGYVTSVDEKNFDEVYAGDYPNVRTFEEDSWDSGSEKEIKFDIEQWGNYSNRIYIITSTDDVNAPSVSCETLIYNNFSDQNVYNSMYDHVIGFEYRYIDYDETYMRFSPGIYNVSTNQVLVHSTYVMTKTVTVIKITVNPSVVIKSSLDNWHNVILDGIEIVDEEEDIIIIE